MPDKRSELAHHRRPLDRRTALRWSVDLVVKFREHKSCTLPVKLIDVSVTGCRLQTGFRLKSKEDAMIVLPGFEPLVARIVWNHDGQTGLRFVVPLHRAVVEHIYRLGNSAALAEAQRVKTLS